jgi:hypothetical protein
MWKNSCETTHQLKLFSPNIDLGIISGKTTVVESIVF